MATDFTGVELISIERERKQARGTRTAEKDAKLDSGELLDAAQCYLHAAFATEDLIDYESAEEFIEDGWPFDGNPNLSDSPVTNLVRAGALIAAEIDRIQAAEAVSVKVKSPDRIESLPIFNDDDLATAGYAESLGFTKKNILGVILYQHDVGLAFSEQSGKWYFAGVPIDKPLRVKDVRNCIDTYKRLNEKSLAELNRVKQTLSSVAIANAFFGK